MSETCSLLVMLIIKLMFVGVFKAPPNVGQVSFNF